MLVDPIGPSDTGKRGSEGKRGEEAKKFLFLFLNLKLGGIEMSPAIQSRLQ